MYVVIFIYIYNLYRPLKFSNVKSLDILQSRNKFIGNLSKTFKFILFPEPQYFFQFFNLKNTIFRNVYTKLYDDTRTH